MSENLLADLGYDRFTMPAPVFVGDTAREEHRRARRPGTVPLDAAVARLHASRATTAPPERP